jgi:hypothetical protein
MTGIPPFAYGYSVEETNRDVRDLAGAVEASSPLPVTSAPLLLRSLTDLPSAIVRAQEVESC